MSPDRVLILAALDIGTTNVKGESRVYVDEQLDQTVTSPSLSLDFSGGLVQVGHFREAIEDVLRQIFGGLDIQRHLASGIRPRLGISQLGEAFFAVDADGDAIDGVLHTSQSPLGRKVMADPGGWNLPRIQEVTARDCGIPATDEMTSVMLLEWLREEPDFRDRVRHIASAGGYLIWLLTGERATSISVLGRAGVADMHRGEVSERILRLCWFNPLWFARVVRLGQPVASIKSSEAERLGLPPSLTIHPPHHDQCTAYEGATALTGLGFGVRTILTGTANGICAPSRGNITDEVIRAIVDQGYCFYPGLREHDRVSLTYHLDGEPEETLLQRLAGGRSRPDAYEALDQSVYESYIVGNEPIESTYVPSRLMSFPVNRFPEGRSFEQSFRPPVAQSAPLTDRSRLRDSMAGKILFIRAGYEAHCRLLRETPQDQLIAYGGGHSKSIVEFQMYADILGKEIRVIRGETGIKGSMLTMLTPKERAGILPSLQKETATAAYQPNPQRVAEFNRIYPQFLEHLRDLYPHIDSSAPHRGKHP
jgi:sugar (pentulose or hexulose) kinase